MLKAKDFRERARACLGVRKTGKVWGTFAIVTLIYILIQSYICWIAGLLLSGPLALGYATVSLNIVRGTEEVKVETLFGGFKNCTAAFVLHLLNGIFIFLWSLLFIIPGIIKSFAYSMSFYILRDNPEMSAGEIRKASIKMMKGNKWRLFCLMFSFIGWYLLSLLTLGILFFWVIPYAETATAAFYESIKTPPVYEEEENAV